MGLAGTRVTDKDNVSLFSNKVTGKTIVNNPFVDRRLKGKINLCYIFKI